MTVVASTLPQEFVDELSDALADAYAGGASGEGWMFIGDPIPKDEMKVRHLEDPNAMRHMARMTNAVREVIERWVVLES